MDNIPTLLHVFLYKLNKNCRLKAKQWDYKIPYDHAKQQQKL